MARSRRHGAHSRRSSGGFRPDAVFAELLNEPDIDADRWQNEVRQLAAFVRASDCRTRR